MARAFPANAATFVCDFAWVFNRTLIGPINVGDLARGGGVVETDGQGVLNTSTDIAVKFSGMLMYSVDGSNYYSVFEKLQA